MRAVAVGACPVGLLCLALPQQAAGQDAETVSADWGLIPSGISEGQSFRLLFVTSTTRNASSATIGDYDTHVQTAAASTTNAHEDIQSYSTHFKVLGSTSAVNARNNTSTRSSDTAAPIYWLNGSKVADDYADFYDDSWDSNSPTDESGTAVTSSEVFTGSSSNGTASGNFVLGRPNGNNVRTGDPTTSGDELDSGSNAHKTNDSKPFYGLSGIFTVRAANPEPTELTVDGVTLTLT